MKYPFEQFAPKLLSCRRARYWRSGFLAGFGGADFGTRPPSKMREEISGRILLRRQSLSVFPGGCASSDLARCCSRSSARC
jgi:hypothetical protein